MKKNGFTLIELLVVIAIVAIFVALILVSMNGMRVMNHTETIRGELVRKFEYNLGDASGTQFRLDVKLESGNVVTLINKDDYWYDKYYSSGTVQANLEEGKWYEFDVRGKRNERWSYYQQLCGAPRQVNPPNQPGDVGEDGEINY